MNVLLCYVFSSFCIVIVASGRLQVTMNGPLEPCPGSENQKLILDDLKFMQRSSDNFTLNGKFVITETINGPISLQILSKKYERGIWVNSLLNQNINDLCTEMEKKDRAEWYKMFDEWTDNKKCPLIQKEGEFKDFPTYNSKTAPKTIPPNFYGKYKTEGRFYQYVDEERVEMACYIVEFEMANV
ncbi:uncharacterized protein LOC119068198 [Bradysia coprophila]|uniref:uncharacterized protein LOC119068198 n=1 Tax=Bradysia coprophila TaxID=38358 RepID=UPI00187DA749|nr:uncharacterized protein LOC119068198 [Bradysia coprophila]